MNYLYRYGNQNYDYAMDRKSGLSVRCLKDQSKLDEEEEQIKDLKMHYSSVKAIE